MVVFYLSLISSLTSHGSSKKYIMLSDGRGISDYSSLYSFLHCLEYHYFCSVMLSNCTVSDGVHVQDKITINLSAKTSMIKPINQRYLAMFSNAGSKGSSIPDSISSSDMLKSTSLSSSVFIWCRGPVHFTGYCYKIPGYEFSKHELNVQK